jgi:hypothetical protein
MGLAIGRIALLTGAAAALSLAATVARAEVYVNETAVVEPTADFYEADTVAPRERIVTVAPRERIVRERIIREEVVEPRERVIRKRVATPRERVVREKVMAAPRERVIRERIVRESVVAPRDEVVVAPRESGIVTTGFSTDRNCFIDLVGRERCY